jgi:hypothetical protein
VGAYLAASGIWPTTTAANASTWARTTTPWSSLRAGLEHCTGALSARGSGSQRGFVLRAPPGGRGCRNQPPRSRFSPARGGTIRCASTAGCSRWASSGPSGSRYPTTSPVDRRSRRRSPGSSTTPGGRGASGGSRRWNHPSVSMLYLGIGFVRLCMGATPKPRQTDSWQGLQLVQPPEVVLHPSRALLAVAAPVLLERVAPLP